MRRPSRRLAPLAVLATGLGGAAIALAPAASADISTVTFPSTGSEQTFVVPDGVHSLHVVLVGGRGGTAQTRDGTFAGGFGAVQDATLTVSPNDTLFVEVGGNGHDGDVGDADTPGGFNGGGIGRSVFGAAGGGASDVRTVSRAAGGSLASRLLVAGGGGGAASGAGGGAGSAVGAPGDTPDPDACPSAGS
jgi:hypothetical protein